MLSFPPTLTQICISGCSAQPPFQEADLDSAPLIPKFPQLVVSSPHLSPSHLLAPQPERQPCNPPASQSARITAGGHHTWLLIIYLNLQINA